MNVDEQLKYPEFVIKARSAFYFSERVDLVPYYEVAPDPNYVFYKGFLCRYTLFMDDDLSEIFRTEIIQINAGHIDRIVAQFQGIHICPYPLEPPLGEDGTLYELQLGLGLAGCATYQWWESGPDIWSELLEITSDLLDLVRAEAQTRGFPPPKTKNW